jgi:hypothetical protein
MAPAPLAVATLAAFALLALFCLAQVARNAKAAHTDAAIDRASHGWNFRVWFHRFMFVGALARTAALGVETAVRQPDDDSLLAWGDHLVHALPAFFFFSTFSLLILFWANLVHEASRLSQAYLWPFFLLLNVAIYLVLLSTAFITLYLRAYHPLGRLLHYLLGCVYVLGAAALPYYGVRVAARIASEDGASRFAHGRVGILRRVVVICAVCTLVFLARGIYSFLAASGALHFETLHFSHAAWDALSLGVLELLPAVVVLALTLRRESGPRLEVAPEGLQTMPFAPPDDELADDALLGGYFSPRRDDGRPL